MVQGLLKTNRNFQDMFNIGNRLSSAYTKNVKLEDVRDYDLKLNPSFLNSLSRKKETLNVNMPINKSKVFKFSTDVENDYFTRYKYRGKFKVYIYQNDEFSEYISKIGPLLNEGLIKYQLKLPEGCMVGDKIKFEFTLDDKSLEKPLN